MVHTPMAEPFVCQTDAVGGHSGTCDMPRLPVLVDVPEHWRLCFAWPLLQHFLLKLFVEHTKKHETKTATTTVLRTVLRTNQLTRDPSRRVASKPKAL